VTKEGDLKDNKKKTDAGGDPQQGKKKQGRKEPNPEMQIKGEQPLDISVRQLTQEKKKIIGRAIPKTACEKKVKA